MGEAGGAHLVELRGVRKSFGDNVVLDGIDLAVARGEAIVIAGPSGSGKSTMLRCINALEEVVDAIAAANRITRKPYKWGGGHGRWRDRGYDCSGSVSYVLHAAGLLKRSRDSTGLMSYGKRGKGEWITVYAHGGHAYVVIAGLRFDTSGRGEEGPRWRLERTRSRGYKKRHPAGL